MFTWQFLCISYLFQWYESILYALDTKVGRCLLNCHMMTSWWTMTLLFMSNSPTQPRQLSSDRLPRHCRAGDRHTPHIPLHTCQILKLRYTQLGYQTFLISYYKKMKLKCQYSVHVTFWNCLNCIKGIFVNICAHVEEIVCSARAWLDDHGGKYSIYLFILRLLDLLNPSVLLVSS